ncbi:hypothetical protein Tsubulata_036883 [Turnera subulata]|uniref:Uncharacterized protein n=1 Tax=Turnera subulata TaxID=218843 RepID=A0A9Q0G3R7_9ROSI|nr:hypothetical protein Tsubulata_036883 [Turnera subulata]
MVIVSLPDWCKNTHIDDVLVRSKSSKCISLANPAALIFGAIRSTLSTMFDADLWVDDVADVQVETSILGRTPVYGVNFPEAKRDPHMHINLERMKANINQLFAIIQHVFMRASDLGVSIDDTDLSFFQLTCEKVESSCANTFKRYCFFVMIHPLLYSRQEKYDFIDKMYRLYKMQPRIYKRTVKMEEGLKAVKGWAETARKSGNKAVKAALDFQSERVGLPYRFDANWRIAAFLRNAIHHVEREHDTTEPKVLEELESIFPHILSKLHLQMWQALGEYQLGSIDYGLLVIRHFMRDPGAFGFKLVF